MNTNTTGTVLYVTKPGACVHQTHGRLRVTLGKVLLQEVRLCDLERVVILGGTAGLTSQAAAGLMECGIETAFLSSTGRFRGWLSPAQGRGVSLRLAQFAAFSDPARRLALAQAVVVQKIKNGDALVARFARNHAEFEPAKERARMARALGAAGVARDVDALLGHEGDAAAAYFAAFGRMLGNGFAFSTRSRRPPRDAANALLSLAYTLLSSEATSAVIKAMKTPNACNSPHAEAVSRARIWWKAASASAPWVSSARILPAVTRRSSEGLGFMAPGIAELYSALLHPCRVQLGDPGETSRSVPARRTLRLHLATP